MTKAWCIWCETGQIPKHGYFWIHPECFERVTSIASNLETIEKYLKGEMPRISKSGNKLGRYTVEQFLIDMYDFDRRWRNSMKLIDAYKEGKAIEEVEFEPPPLQDCTQLYTRGEAKMSYAINMNRVAEVTVKLQRFMRQNEYSIVDIERACADIAYRNKEFKSNMLQFYFFQLQNTNQKETD